MQSQKRSDKELQDEFTSITEKSVDSMHKREMFAVSLR